MPERDCLCEKAAAKYDGKGVKGRGQRLLPKMLRNFFLKNLEDSDKLLLVGSWKGVAYRVFCEWEKNEPIPLTGPICLR
jgi:hypothetical protein